MGKNLLGCVLPLSMIGAGCWIRRGCYSLFEELEEEEEELDALELLESDEALEDFSAGFFSDFESDDLPSPSAEAFMEPPDFDLPP
jgi:hypothetical protein